MKRLEGRATEERRSYSRVEGRMQEEGRKTEERRKKKEERKEGCKTEYKRKT